MQVRDLTKMAMCVALCCVTAEFVGLSFAAAPNIHDNFAVHFNGSGRFAGFRDG